MSEVNLFELFHSNKESEEDGRWVDLTDTTRFKVRALGSQVVIDLRDKLSAPYQSLVRAGGEIPKEKNEEITLKVIAGAVLADWTGVKNAAGEVVPFSADEAYAILKALPKFTNFIIGFSSDAQNYRDKAREEAAGN